MRNFLMFGLFISLLIIVQFSSAQTVDDIIERYIEAMGGKEKLVSLKSVKMEGSMNVQGNEVSIVTTKLQGVGVRLDLSIMGTENYQIFTPTKGWTFMPVQGQDALQEVPQEILNFSLPQLDIQGALYDYKTKGHKVELLGKESIEGSECYKLKITFASGTTSSYFLDTKTYRINKVSSIRSMNGEEMEVFNVYSNFKQNDQGYWFPYTSVNVQGEINYAKIETNIKVDENIFAPAK